MYITNGYSKKVFYYAAGSLENFHKEIKEFYSLFKDSSVLDKNYLVCVADHYEKHNLYFDVIGGGGRHLKYCKDYKGDCLLYESTEELKIVVV
jgi:hypothetical protein